MPFRTEPIERRIELAEDRLTKIEKNFESHGAQLDAIRRGMRNTAIGDWAKLLLGAGLILATIGGAGYALRSCTTAQAEDGVKLCRRACEQIEMRRFVGGYDNTPCRCVQDRTIAEWDKAYTKATYWEVRQER